MEARSRKYGTRTNWDNAINFHPENYMMTTSRESFVKPSSINNPTWRARTTMVETKFDKSAKLIVAPKAYNRASGFASNRQEQDGLTWATDKCQHTDMVRTSYRNNFNKPKPFHKLNIMVTDGRLKRKEQVFDIDDK